jgi:hypothetical protein
MKSFYQFMSEAAIEYVTGDRTHRNYAADHGGSNYHDHIAFKDEKTRKAAQEYLKKQGWEIGSTTGGRHAERSFHYSGQAFDIPMYRPSGRGVQHGFSDDRKGEEAMSRKLRADLAKGGFGGGPLGGGHHPGDGHNHRGSSAPKPVAAPSAKGALDTPAPSRVLAKLKGKTGEKDLATGKFSQRGWSDTEGSRYKSYGGK